jgi:HlyD family secretion protein
LTSPTIARAPRSTLRRLLPWVIAAVVLGGAGLLAVRFFGGGSDAAPAYVTEPASRGTVVSTVTATGTLSARNTVQVGSQVSGRVLELRADFNDRVSKGQVIARIDPQIFQSEVAKARANLQAAQANLTRTKAAAGDAALKRKRAEALRAEGVVAEADVETAQVDDTSARANETASIGSLAQARAALAQAEVNLAYTTIVSPIDGVVISRDVDVGQTVAASLQAPTLFTIAEDLRAMEVHTSVAESDVGRLRDEMEVVFTVDAFPDERFRGVVKQIRNAPTTVSNVVTYDAVIGVSNDELKLRPGMTANVTFRVDERKDVVTVASAALRFSPPEAVIAALPEADRALLAAASQRRGRGREPSPAPSPSPSPSPSPAPSPAPSPEPGAERPRRNQRIVWLLGPSGQLRPQRVEIGLSDGRITEITAGLDEGAAVVTGVAGAAPGGAGGPPAGGARGGGGMGGGRRIF